MRQFLFKLIAPRPTFAQDMTEAERKVMQDHVVYWKGLADRGVAVVFGPVFDPRGVRGGAEVPVSDGAAARALVPNDPVFKAHLGQIEVYPMSSGTIVRKLS